MYYSLYSLLSTVSLNWDLPSLGRWDCDANVFPPLSHILSYTNTDISSLFLLPADSSTSSNTLSSEERKKHHPHWNRSYPGPASLKKFTPGWWPVPNTVAKCVSGRGVLEKVRQTWGDHQRGSYNYTSVYPHHRSFDGLGNPVEAITTVSRLVMTGADVEDVDAAAGDKATNGTEIGPDTDTETIVYGDGPLKPIDGVMDRGFSSSHHQHHRQHHSHHGSNGVDKGDDGDDGDDGNDDGWNEEGNGQINGNTIRGTTKKKNVFHNGVAPGISLLRISSRIELVLLLQFGIAMGVAWIL